MMLLLCLVLTAPADAGPLTLAEAVAAARGGAPDAAVIDARVQQARAEAGVARAPLYPQLSGSYVYRHNDKEVSFPSPFDPTGQTLLTIQELDVHQATASASLPVVNASLWARAAAAGNAVDAAEAQAEAARLDLDLRVASLWLAARSAGELRRATEQALGDTQKHEAMVKVALAAGTVTPLAADRARVAVLEAQQRLLDATRGEQDLLGQLRVLVGADEAVSVEDGPLPAPGALPDEAAAVEAALARRPELAAARVAARTNAGRLVTVGEWAPSLTAIGNYTWTNSPMFTDEPTSWYLGVSASLPVLDGGLRFSDTKRLATLHAIAEDQLAKLEASTREDVHAALRAERAAAEALTLAREQEVVAEHSRELAESWFGVGTATALDVEDAQAAALQARVGRIRAEAAWLGARWQRMRLCGEGLALP